jgi:hypothetical protein
MIQARESPLSPEPGADLGRDDHVVPLAAALQPVADHDLGLAALVAAHPHRIHVRGVDCVDAGGYACVEQLERGRFIGGPAEHVAAEHQWREFDAGTAQLTLLHCLFSLLLSR